MNQMNLFPRPTTQIAEFRAAWNHLPSREYVFLLMALIALYCVFHEGARNILFSECYKLRFMKNTGSPASIRTAVIAFALWSATFVTCFFPSFWNWNYSGMLFIAGFISVMLSSYLDARSFRNRNWR